jgi:hypothetical protein
MGLTLVRRQAQGLQEGPVLLLVQELRQPCCEGLPLHKSAFVDGSLKEDQHYFGEREAEEVARCIHARSSGSTAAPGSLLHLCRHPAMQHSVERGGACQQLLNSRPRNFGIARSRMICARWNWLQN